MYISQFKLLVIPPGTLSVTLSNLGYPLYLRFNLGWYLRESLGDTICGGEWDLGILYVDVSVSLSVGPLSNHLR